jgi:SAM-dependent methyltransferase
VSKILFADLGAQPIPNDFLHAGRLMDPEIFYPLRASFDTETKLVQLDYPLKREAIFDENYPYFSSQSATFLKHAEMYAHEMIERFHPKSVVEVGSNDGYLLQYFQKEGLHVYGFDPCRSVAEAAIKKGILTDIKFFGLDTGRDVGNCADLMIANNVLAHVPDLDDFVSGFREALAPEGVATFEFPHLLNLIQQNQFDTIYHEHYSYLSLMAVTKLFMEHGLRVFDVQELPVHGGSLRVFACLQEAHHRTTLGVVDVIRQEMEAGLDRDEVYESFNEKVRATKRELLDLLIMLKRAGHSIVGYGAPAKGNTLLNYCGIGKDFLDFVVDTTPAKQGMYLPGSRIPVLHPAALDEVRPDYVLILPWNFKNEIMGKLAHIREWGGRFIVPIPRPEIIL